jgi:membrane protein YqaA with SNARE-associated domain
MRIQSRFDIIVGINGMSDDQKKAIEADYTPAQQQENTGKQWASFMGSLTFIAMLLPRFLSGLPSIDHVVMAGIGAAVMGVLGYQLGHILGTPNVKHVSKKSMKKAAPVKEVAEQTETEALSED